MQIFLCRVLLEIQEMVSLGKRRHDLFYYLIVNCFEGI